MGLACGLFSASRSCRWLLAALFSSPTPLASPSLLLARSGHLPSGRSSLGEPSLGRELELTGLEEGKAPPTALGGKNDYGRTDWSGPCPPIGKAHRFIFTLLALGEPSGLAEGASPRDDLPYALSGKVLGQTQLTVKYARRR